MRNVRPAAAFAGAALLVLVALACEGQDEAPSANAPPLVEEPAEEVPDGPPAGIDHVVQPGETLWAIARAYGVTIADILVANEMQPADARRLSRGRSLRIPGAEAVIDLSASAPAEEPPESSVDVAEREAGAEPAPLPEGPRHRLARGETLWDVARLYEVSLTDLQAANAFDDDQVRMLREGQRILVPGATERQIERIAERRAEEAPARTRGFRHTVARGETIWDLAGAFGVTTSEIMAANGLDRTRAGQLRAGTRLYIPGVERDRRGQVRRRLSRAQRQALQRARQLGLGTRELARDLIHGRVPDRVARAARNRWRRGRAPGTLRWPVTRGWFVRGFGSGEGQYHLAVDIMGEIGWNVRAAAAGLVAYAGDEVPGFGNMVLLVHPGGWVTLYAHNSTNLVVAGQRVPAGGILGEVGSTGISRGPHVHFELIHDGMNCDPAALFRPGIRHRDGHLSPIPRVSWTEVDERPERVQCTRRRRHPRSRWVSREGFSAGSGTRN